MNQCKPFTIPKRLVWESYLDVCRNKGAPGVDGRTIADFNRCRDANLYKLWNRLSSGSYQTAPVLEKRIPKSDGKERILGIPTVEDRIAQGAIKRYVEERIDPIFDKDSYGYRPGKSAHQAIAKCMERTRPPNSWVLEIDIQSFFDTVRHDLVLKALEHHDMPRWVLLYCKRWLEAPIVTKGSQEPVKPREMGTPQGGVISPLLANLFLHYGFDVWMQRNYPRVPFERYADDIVCHVPRMNEGVRLKAAIQARMKEVGLTLHPQKSQVVYIDKFKRMNVATEFTFLGYTFRQRTVKDGRSGKLFRSCMPGASKKAMKKITQVITSWRIHRSTKEDISIFAQRHNATLRGWVAYYGKFCNSNFFYNLWRVFQARLLKWMKAKYRISGKKAQRKLNRIQREYPKLFVHWNLPRAVNGLSRAV